MGDGKSNRFLPITRCFHVDTSGCAHRRAASVRTNHEVATDLGVVGQTYQGVGRARDHVGKSDACFKGHVGQLSQSCDHLAAQKPVGQVPAKRQVRHVSRIKVSSGANGTVLAACIDDPHDL